MKKVILHVFYSGLGGHGSVFFSLVSADRSNIFSTKVILYGIEQPRDEYVSRLDILGIDFKYVHKRQGVDITFWRDVLFCIKQAKPDTIFLHGSYNLLPAIFYKYIVRKCKIVVRETQANHLKTKLDWLLLFLSTKLADVIVFLSSEYKNEVENKFQRSHKLKNSFVIPNGIDLDFFKRKQISCTNLDVCRFGMVSRIVKIKDHITLIKAFANLARSDTYLYIAGDGPTLPDLRQLTIDLKISDRVLFVGVIDEASLPDFFNSLDIYVHATFGETMSTAIMQAQSSGLPVIATNVPGVNNIIADGVNGLLVESNDVDSYELAFKKLLEDPILRSQLSDSSRLYAVANLSMDNMFAKYEKLL